MKKIIFGLFVFLFTSFVFASNIDVKNVNGIIDYLGKDKVISGLKLSDEDVLSSPLSKAESTLLLYNFLKLKQADINFPLSGDIEFYPKYSDLYEYADFYEAATLLQIVKGYDDVTVLPLSVNSHIFDPLHHMTKYEFVKMLVELINIKKFNDYTLSSRFADYNQLSKEKQIYFSTALKAGIKFSNGNKIEADKKLTIYDALIMLDSLKNYKIPTYKKTDFLNIAFFVFRNNPSNKVGMINEMPKYDPDITGVNIVGVDQVLSGNCMKLSVNVKKNPKIKDDSYIWESDFGYIESLKENNSEVIFCPSTKEPIEDYHISLTADDGFMNFTDYNFTIDKSKFKYIKNIGDENSKSIKFNLSLSLKDKVLKEGDYFVIYATGGLFKNNLNIGLEKVSIVLKSGKNAYYINDPTWSDDTISFLVPSNYDIDYDNVSLDVIYATNYKFGHKVFNLSAQPHYSIAGQIDSDDEGKYPKCIYINDKKVEVSYNGHFYYSPEKPGKYIIKVNDRHYRSMTFNLTNEEPTYDSIYIDYMNLDYDYDGVENDKDAFPYDPAVSLDSDGDGYPDRYNTGYYSSLYLLIDKFPHDEYRYKSKYDATSGSFYGYLTYSKCFDPNKKGRLIDLINYKKDYCFFFNDYLNNRMFYVIDKDNKLLKNVLEPNVNYSIYLKGLAISTTNLGNGVFPRCKNCRIYKLIKVDNIKVDKFGTVFYPKKAKTLITYNQYLKLENAVKKLLEKKLTQYKAEKSKKYYLLGVYSKTINLEKKLNIGDTSKGLNLQLYYVIDSVRKATNDLLNNLDK